MRQTHSEFAENDMTRLKEKIGHLFHKRSNNNDYESVIETDYLGSTHGSESQVSTLNKGAPNRVELVPAHSTPKCDLHTCHTAVNEAYDAYEQERSFEMHCQDLNTQLQSALRSAKDKLLGKDSEVFLPKDLIDRISRDVVLMSECEPCGIRGCVIYATLERPNDTIQLFSLPVSRETVSTFEVYLTVREDKKRWHSLKELIFPVVPGCLLNPFQEEVFLSQGFQLVKKKLYRPNY